MQDSLNIIFASSEVTPFAKTGGLADVSYSLPKAIKSLGHYVGIIMPMYKIVDANKYNIQEIDLIPVPTYDGYKEAQIYKTNYNGMDIFFVGNREYFDRDGLYGDGDNSYPDNLMRFSFFNRAVLEFIKRFDKEINIIHCNDWQTALIPVYLKSLYTRVNKLNHIKVVYTIHSLAYQGLFPAEQYEHLGLDWKYFTPNDFEFYGQVNLMKAGILWSDYITTVSKQYAKEIMTPQFGYGLEGVIRSRYDVVEGIVNGVDYSEWDPRTDEYIYSLNYDENTFYRKADIKARMLAELGIKNVDKQKPLIGIVSRLINTKGIDLILMVFDRMMELDVYFVLLGVGEKRYHDAFKGIANEYKDRVSINLNFDPILAHKIQAASDIYIMPSSYEPCGLSQLYSLKYGTIPVVYAIGGLYDTIKDEKTGFLFYNYNDEDFFNAIKKAVDLYRNDKEKWYAMIKMAMKEDWSWNRSAKKYIEVYERLVEGQ